MTPPALHERPLTISSSSRSPSSPSCSLNAPAPSSARAGASRVWQCSAASRRRWERLKSPKAATGLAPAASDRIASPRGHMGKHRWCGGSMVACLKEAWRLSWFQGDTPGLWSRSHHINQAAVFSTDHDALLSGAYPAKGSTCLAQEAHDFWTSDVRRAKIKNLNGGVEKDPPSPWRGSSFNSGISRTPPAML